MKKLYDKKVISAFTLAEVMITLLIIGVIASLTIPALIQKIGDAGTTETAKKYQGVLTNAVTALMVQNKFETLSGHYANVGSFWNDFKANFRVLKDCGTAVNKGCLPTTSYLHLNGADTGISDSTASTRSKAVLADGVSIMILQSSVACTADSSIANKPPLNTVCYIVHVDVNGKNDPNRLGVDDFSWWITADGSVIPVGTPDDTFNGCDPSSADATPGSDGAPGSGTGCTAALFMAN